MIGFDVSIQSCGHRLFKGLLQAVLERVGYNKAQAWIGSHRPPACFQTKGGLQVGQLELNCNLILAQGEQQRGSSVNASATVVMLNL